MSKLKNEINRLYKQCSQNSLLENIAYMIPFLIIIAILFTFIWFFSQGKGITGTKGLLMLGAPAILSALFLINSYKNTRIISNSFHTINISHKLPTLIFIFLYCLSIIALLINDGRSLSYFILLTTIYSIIFLQIISKKDASSLILIEISLCMLNLIYGVVFKYPLYFGYTDIFYHLFISKVTYLTGFVIPAELSLSYTNFPLYHILVAESSYLTGVDIQNTLFLITAPVFSILVVFVYYVFYRSTENSKISLLTSMLFSVSPVVVTYGAYIITRTIAFVGFIIILYLIYANLDKMITRALLLLLSFFLLLVHQVSFPQILFLLIILGLCQHITQKRTYIRYEYIQYLSLILIFYWIYISVGFTENLIDIYAHSELYETVIVLEGSIIRGDTSQAIWRNLIDYLDMSIFIFFSFIGIGYSFWNDKKKIYTPVFTLFSLIVLPLFVPNPLQELWQTMDLFRFDRFMLLISPFMAFAMSYGVFTFYKHYSKAYFKKKSVMIILLIVSLSIFTFISITTNIQDENMLSSQAPREYFTEEELAGFSHVSNFVPFQSQLYSDYFTKRYFGPYKFFNGSNMYNLPYYDSNEIDKPSEISKYSGYWIMRDKAFSQGGLYIGPGHNELYIKSKETNRIFTNNFKQMNQIYSNPHISIYSNTHISSN
ncbi:hypothetical protein EFE42_00560 [Methanohalophilus sp. RSK]|uniref:hypothetical protein n=1 Tax=Methanohalophilus sp. RSK TaxID=2485783 RepID=UPI000F43A99E|nr:hypothetical protein [Methanohalophilus sp. RSK]RNI15769.1 hypothetical protein EFE42_00560 [Methanohalophilus sp. RSK]